MITLKGELKEFKDKALVSQDKGLELKIYAIINNENSVNLNNLDNLLHKPISISLTELNN